MYMYQLSIGFSKKVDKVAKLKGCEVVGEWTHSMVNHLYWTITSTEDSDKQMVLQKWMSLLNHVHNVHRGHGKIFKKCSHGKLSKRKWLKHRKYYTFPGILFNVCFHYFIDTKPSEKLTKIITNKSLCSDIGRLSNKYQTSSLESFHSLLNHFAPKHTAFSYNGMIARFVLY